MFSSGVGNLISISDADADTDTSSIQVQVVSTNGTTTLSGTTGLTFSVGDGTADTTMTFTGNITDINLRLAGLTFTPATDFTSAASLQILTSDQGKTGTGGTLTDDDTIAITVTRYQVTSTIPVGADPFGVDVYPTTNTIYVTNESESMVSVISASQRP